MASYTSNSGSHTLEDQLEESEDENCDPWDRKLRSISHSSLFRFGVTWAWHECDKEPSLRQEISSLKSHIFPDARAARPLWKMSPGDLWRSWHGDLGVVTEGRGNYNNYFQPEMHNKTIIITGTKRNKSTIPVRFILEDPVSVRLGSAVIGTVKGSAH